MDPSQRTSAALLGTVPSISYDFAAIDICIPAFAFFDTSRANWKWERAERASGDMAQLLKRFENLLAMAPIENTDRTVTAVTSYQMEVETAALIRSAESLLSLTRILKEAWLFGKLNTYQENDSSAEDGAAPAASETDEIAMDIVRRLRRMEDGDTKPAETLKPIGE